nr:hypothetical protein [Tanacetum cinerariifolium]
IGEQILDNNNGWLKEEPEEEDNEAMVNDEEDDAEVINPYKEADPYNRPPPTSDEETEFAPPVVLITDANDEDDAEVINPYKEADPYNRPPPTSDEETEFAPPVVLITDANDVPIPPCHPVWGVKRLSKQMHDRYSMEKKMAKILRQDELHKNGQEFDI